MSSCKCEIQFFRTLCALKERMSPVGDVACTQKNLAVAPQESNVCNWTLTRMALMCHMYTQVNELRHPTRGDGSRNLGQTTCLHTQFSHAKCFSVAEFRNWNCGMRDADIIVMAFPHSVCEPRVCNNTDIYTYPHASSKANPHPSCASSTFLLLNLSTSA